MGRINVHAREKKRGPPGVVTRAIFSRAARLRDENDSHSRLGGLYCSALVNSECKRLSLAFVGSS